MACVIRGDDIVILVHCGAPERARLICFLQIESSDGGSSRCILMVIYFALLAASFCLCGFCLRDFCRQYWNRRKTIPYTDEDPVPGTVGDAAPPDAVENAAAAEDVARVIIDS